MFGKRQDGDTGKPAVQMPPPPPAPAPAPAAGAGPAIATRPQRIEASEAPSPEERVKPAATPKPAAGPRATTAFEQLRNAQNAKAANNGQMISETGPKSKATEALNLLAQIISRREPPPVAKKSLFAGLLKK